MQIQDSLEGHRVLILTGAYQSEEGICLGKVARDNCWAVSPDCSTAVLQLRFKSEFALLLNSSAARAPSGSIRVIRG